MNIDYIMISGVYTITNTKTNEIYVGSATRYISTRFGDHRRKLDRKIHGNTHLQRSYSKYGKEAFKFEILELYPSHLCVSMELYWINMLDTFHNGFNMSIPNVNGGFRLSNESRKIMSEKAKSRDISHLYTEESRKKISKAISKRNKTNHVRKNTGKYGKCERFDIDWNLIETYNSVYDAFRDMNLRNASHLLRASKSKGTRCGFRWKVYTKDEKLVE